MGTYIFHLVNPTKTSKPRKRTNQKILTGKRENRPLQSPGKLHYTHRKSEITILKFKVIHKLQKTSQTYRDDGLALWTKATLVKTGVNGKFLNFTQKRRPSLEQFPCKISQNGEMVQNDKDSFTKVLPLQKSTKL